MSLLAHLDEMADKHASGPGQVSRVSHTVIKRVYDKGDSTSVHFRQPGYRSKTEIHNARHLAREVMLPLFAEGVTPDLQRDSDEIRVDPPISIQVEPRSFDDA